MHNKIAAPPNRHAHRSYSAGTLVASWFQVHAVVVHIRQVVAVDELALGVFL